jgi:putative PIN family toxin of toxin-antitoxin system
VRAVFDTNVLVAAFLAEGVCSKLLLRARKGECALILSLDILEEFEGVLRNKFSLSPSEVSEVHTLLAEAAREIVKQISPITPLCRDPDDDKILACAQAVRADYIVTGDRDLLVIKTFGKTQIITPRDFEALFSD